MTHPKIDERECPACKESGFEIVEQSAEPGRKIYPPRCERCDGKGRVAVIR
jgi:DnaJ-class molecular chaperone